MGLTLCEKCYLQVHTFNSRNKVAPLTCIIVLVEELKVSEIFVSALCWAIMLSIRCPQGLESHCGEFHFLFDRMLFWSLWAELLPHPLCKMDYWLWLHQLTKPLQSMQVIIQIIQRTVALWPSGTDPLPCVSVVEFIYLITKWLGKVLLHWTVKLNSVS